MKGCRSDVAMAIATLLAVVAPAMAQNQTPPPFPAPDTAATIMNYYPQKARAAGIEGKAILDCDLTEHIALRNCRMAYEAPKGDGFGDAALALAELSNGNPEITTQGVSGAVEFTFTLHPPSISPDTLGQYHLTTLPKWFARPTGDQIEEAFPPAAMQRRISGRTVMDCEARPDTHLGACKVTEEVPPGYGFGAATLAVSKFFKVVPGTRDGVSMGDVQVPIQWMIGH